jgi:GDSL-like Lipase/Acylhydrolase family
LAAAGDSITADGIWLSILATQYLSWQLTNAATAGWTYVEILADYPVRVEPVYHALGRNILVVWIGSNDILFNHTAATMEAQATAYAALASPKFKIVFCPVLKRVGATVSQETERAAYNTWIAANYALIGGSAFANLQSVPEALDPSNATYFPDGIHPSAALHALLVPVIRDAIQTIP